jgi:Nucleotidyl transferase
LRRMSNPLFALASPPRLQCCAIFSIRNRDVKMDYQKMLQHHLDTGAELTIGTIEFDRSEASRFGVLETDMSGRIVGWQEKPADPKPAAWDPNKCKQLKVPGGPGGLEALPCILNYHSCGGFHDPPS